MLLTKVKVALTGLLVAGLLVAGVSAIPRPTLAETPGEERLKDQPPDKSDLSAPKAPDHAKLRSMLEGHANAVTSLAFSPEGKVIASESAV